jgi:hypothetical protein
MSTSLLTFLIGLLTGCFLVDTLLRRFGFSGSAGLDRRGEKKRSMPSSLNSARKSAHASRSVSSICRALISPRYTSTRTLRSSIIFYTMHKRLMTKGTSYASRNSRKPMQQHERSSRPSGPISTAS